MMSKKRKNMPGYIQKQDAAGRMQWMREVARYADSATDGKNVRGDFVSSDPTELSDDDFESLSVSSDTYDRLFAAEYGPQHVKQELAQDDKPIVRMTAVESMNEDNK